jgi:Ca-activated chloride channel family protein
VFEFDYPWVLALVALPVLMRLLLPAYREREESVRIPFFEQAARALGMTPARGGVSLRKNPVQRVLGPLVWILLVVAAARPQLVEPPIQKVESARDLMLAVDLSGSMDTRDMFDADEARVRRIDVVKAVLDEFIERREGDRLGIIVFGTQAFLQAPFTQDHELVRTLLDQLEPRMAGPQTMIGDAIGLTVKAFQQSAAQDKVLVLLTDGNDTGSKVPPRKAADLAARDEVVIHTVAVGDPESVGEAEMDLASLDEIARVTGGTAFTADDREQLEDIYRQIDALTPEEINTISYRPTRPLFHLPVGAAVLLILVYHLGMAGLVATRSWRWKEA